MSPSTAIEVYGSYGYKEIITESQWQRQFI
jgi:hypothetical protein